VGFLLSLLSHSEFLTKIGKTKESDVDFQHAICIFRKHNLDRLTREQGIACPVTCLKDQSKEKVRTNIWKLVFGTTNEKALPEDLFEDKADAITSFCQADYGFPHRPCTAKACPWLCLGRSDKRSKWRHSLCTWTGPAPLVI
jgi:hypothetical protein